MSALRSTGSDKSPEYELEVNSEVSPNVNDNLDSVLYKNCVLEPILIFRVLVPIRPLSSGI